MLSCVWTISVIGPPLQDTPGDQHYSSDNWQERDFFPSSNFPSHRRHWNTNKPAACLLWYFSCLGKNLPPLIHQAQDISCSYLPVEIQIWHDNPSSHPQHYWQSQPLLRNNLVANRDKDRINWTKPLWCFMNFVVRTWDFHHKNKNNRKVFNIHLRRVLRAVIGGESC